MLGDIRKIEQACLTLALQLIKNIYRCTQTDNAMVFAKRLSLTCYKHNLRRPLLF